MSEDAASRLAHDVGKYIARIARNVPEDGPVPAALVPLLVKDLYEAPGGGRPSERFEALAATLSDPRLAVVRADLAALDALEPAVRAAEERACREACRLARGIESALRSVAGEGGA